jgi:hypothetical protein
MTPLLNNEQAAPKEFICPISLRVMKSPVVSKGGQSFDRKSILEWLQQGNSHCPLTREPLISSLLVPNYPLKSSIKKWKLDKGGEEDDETDDASISSASSSEEDENGIVGIILNFDPHLGSRRTRILNDLSLPTNDNDQQPVDDDLSSVTNYQMLDDGLDYLLELFNELRMEMPAFSPIAEAESSTPPQSSGISHQVVVAEPSTAGATAMGNHGVSRNEQKKKRRWRPKIFSKNKSS